MTNIKYILVAAAIIVAILSPILPARPILWISCVLLGVALILP